jgi:hypothetical protein
MRLALIDDLERFIVFVPTRIADASHAWLDRLRFEFMERKRRSKLSAVLMTRFLGQHFRGLSGEDPDGNDGGAQRRGQLRPHWLNSAAAVCQDKRESATLAVPLVQGAKSRRFDRAGKRRPILGE